MSSISSSASAEDEFRSSPRSSSSSTGDGEACALPTWKTAEYRKQKNKEYYEKHKKEQLERVAKWREENYDKYLESSRNTMKRKYYRDKAKKNDGHVPSMLTTCSC
jgi:hypothetical protein